MGLILSKHPVCIVMFTHLFEEFDIHGFLHHDKICTKMAKKIQRCRIIYCSSTALHVPSDIFAHH